MDALSAKRTHSYKELTVYGDVEDMIMQGMRKKLFTCTLDQEQSQVNVVHVQPRRFTKTEWMELKQQIQTLKTLFV
jgi:hypothetical protein